MDVGGTFTDVVAIDERTGQSISLKGLTTSEDPSAGIVQLIRRLRVAPEEIRFLSHGTTMAINALIQGKGDKTGLLATEGFRDVLELRRSARTHIMDPFMRKPPIFIPRRWRRELKERVLASGTVLEPLDEDHAREVIGGLADEGIESVAVCLLNAHANSAHEQRLKQLIAEDFHLECSLSSEILPQIGEFERASTTAINAYIQPFCRRHLAGLAKQIRELGVPAEVHVMQSNGGIMTWQEAVHKPVHIIESGPAGGVMASIHVGRLLGIENMITFDMGGTTSKACVIESGVPESTTDFEIFAEPDKPGSGWPIGVPVIQIIETGAGGGSVAWIDTGDSLRVGPLSAGSTPGPICYDRGGREPTITDAHTILGRLEALLDGELPLEVLKARAVMQSTLAKPLGLEVEQVAKAIIDIANAKTADLIREVTVAKGRDPRGLALMAFGGAGPLCAAHIVEQLDLPQAIIPPVPGNFSAIGLLATDLVHDMIRTSTSQIGQVDLVQLNGAYGDLEREGRRIASGQGVPDKHIEVTRSADMRYLGQAHVVNLTIPLGSIDEATLCSAEAAFHRRHRELYTFAVEEEIVELVHLRVRVTGLISRPAFPEIEATPGEPVPSKHRQVYFGELGGYVECSIYARGTLGRGSAIRGPAVIEELTSTTLVPPGFMATVDKLANLILTKEQGRPLSVPDQPHSGVRAKGCP